MFLIATDGCTGSLFITRRQSLCRSSTACLVEIVLLKNTQTPYLSASRLIKDWLTHRPKQLKKKEKGKKTKFSKKRLKV